MQVGRAVLAATTVDNTRRHGAVCLGNLVKVPAAVPQRHESLMLKVYSHGIAPPSWVDCTRKKAFLAIICTVGMWYFHLAGPSKSLPLLDMDPVRSQASALHASDWRQDSLRSSFSAERPHAPGASRPYSFSRPWEDLIPSPCDRRVLSRQSAEARSLCAQPPSLDPPAGETSFTDLIPTYTADGKHIANRPAWEVHTKGLLHKASQVLLFDESGQHMLLNERSHTKWIWPGAAGSGQGAVGPDPAIVALAPETVTPAEITVNTPGFTPSVEVYSVDGVAGYTTYRLAVSIPKEERSLYSVYGHKAGPLIVPAAWQHKMGVSKGGPKLGFIEIMPEIEFDSYLTCGVTDGKANLGADPVMTHALENWSEEEGLQVENGAVFWMNPNGAQDIVSTSDPIVVAQLTLPTGTSHMAQMQMQGRSDVGRDDWNAGVSFLIGARPPPEAIVRGKQKIAESLGNTHGMRATIWDTMAETVEVGDSNALEAALRGVKEEFGVSSDDILDLSNHWLQEHAKESILLHEPDQPVARQTVCWRGRMPHMLLDDCELIDTFVFHVRQAKMEEIVATGQNEEELREESNEISSFRICGLKQLAVEIKADPMVFSPWFLATWFDCSECWPKGTDREKWPLPSDHGL